MKNDIGECVKLCETPREIKSDLPCSVDDLVYLILYCPKDRAFKVKKAIVKEIRIGEFRKPMNLNADKYMISVISAEGNKFVFLGSDLGKEIFTTREEAEKMLKMT